MEVAEQVVVGRRAQRLELGQPPVEQAHGGPLAQADPLPGHRQGGLELLRSRDDGLAPRAPSSSIWCRIARHHPVMTRFCDSRRRWASRWRARRRRGPRRAGPARRGPRHARQPGGARASLAASASSIISSSRRCDGAAGRGGAAPTSRTGARGGAAGGAAARRTAATACPRARWLDVGPGPGEQLDGQGGLQVGPGPSGRPGAGQDPPPQGDRVVVERPGRASPTPASR